MIDTTKLFSRKFLTTTHNVTTQNYMWWRDSGNLDLNASYQRDYVWTNREQQEFLYSIFNNLPLGHIALIDRDSWVDDVANYEIVDGKQRITTLLKFFDNEIAYKVDGVEVFYKDLDIVSQRQVKNKTLPYQQLINVTEKDKLEYFYRVNFSGVPQSEEHRIKIIELLGGVK